MVLNALLAALALWGSSGAEAAPAFARYPAPVAHVRHAAPPRIEGTRSRRYRSELRRAAAGPPDFAGHYVLASIGCGASCIAVAAIDRRTGRVAWLPSTVCCWPLEVSEPLTYRRDSRLLVVQGELDEKEPAARRRFLFDGTRFTPLAD